ncbi:hypothetical protein QQM79_14125 [Marinobacteraceae bacterium S3BR75-40.1]
MSNQRHPGLRAAARALFHGVLVFGMMMLVDFSISGTLEAYQWYLWAALIVTLFLIPRYRHQDIQQSPPLDQQHQP